MKLTQLLRLVLDTFLWPSLGLTIGLSIVIPPALAEAQTINQTTQQTPPRRTIPGEENDLPPRELPPRPPTAGDLGPPVGRPEQSSYQAPASAAEQGSNGNALPQIRYRFPINAINAVLDVRAQSDAFRELQIFDSEKEKDTFGFSLRRTLSRTPTSDFSLSLGLSYLDESLLPPPLDSTRDASPPSPLLPSSEELPPGARPPATRGPSPSGRPVVLTPVTVASDSNRPPAAPTEPPPPGVPTPDSAFGGLPIPPQVGGRSNVIRTGVLQFSQNYRQRDDRGQWLVRSQFNLGTELANTPPQMNADAQFFSWTGRLERTQNLNDNHQLTVQLETQLSPSNLLPPHQFKMKDRQFEAFGQDARPSEINGNNGIRLRLADRVALIHNVQNSPNTLRQPRRGPEPILALIPFVDVGYTWGQGNLQLPNEQFLGRAGLGLSMQPVPQLNFQIDYLTYWGDRTADSNAQDLYLMVGYQQEW